MLLEQYAFCFKLKSILYEAFCIFVKNEWKEKSVWK